jgi:integrase/recombinase XerD
VIEPVLSTTVIAASCLAGRRACPPEDCGGPWGYAHRLGVLAGPAHDEQVELSKWVGGSFDPEAFDLTETNSLLRALI